MKKSSILNEFYIDGKDPETSHVFLHITEPVSYEEKQKGLFFGVIEFRQVKPESAAKFQDLIKKIETAYFEDTSLNNAVAWENAVRTGNQLTQGIKTKGKIDMCVANLSEGKLRVTAHGEPIAWLIYQIKNQLKILDILEAQKEQKVFFENIIEGNLKEGHRVLIASPSFLKIMNKERFLKINKEKTAGSAAIYIQKFLETLKNGLSYGGILFEWRNEPRGINDLMENKFMASGCDSVGALANKEKMTEALLSPSLINIARKIKDKIKNLPVQSLKNISYNDLWPRVIKKINSLPSKMRGLLLLALVLVVVLAGSILTIKWKEQKKIERNEWEGRVAAIIQKKNQIEASLIYDDQTQATALLLEARRLINELPVNSRRKKEELKQLNASLDNVAKDLQKITEVEGTLVLEIGKDKKIDKIAAVGPNLFLIGKEIYFKKGADLKLMPELSAVQYAVSEDGLLYILSQNGGLTKIAQDGSLMQLNPLEDDPKKTMVDLAIYNARLYSLDPFRNMIVRLPKSENGFGAPQRWSFEDNLILGDAQEFSVEGKIFVLKKDNVVYRLNKGHKEEFNLPSIDPALENVFGIYAAPNADELFLAENAAMKRILRFDKNGKLKRQYTSPSWKNLRDFAVEPNTKTIYILNEDKVESFKY